MREIKFRGKRLDNGEWAYGSLVVADKQFFIIIDTTRFYPELYGRSPLAFMDWYEVDPTTVGQYTGLKDKNGAEIFEGDIVTFNNNNFKVICKQDRYYIGWVATDEGENRYTHIWYDGIEVSGNIHDNPELLEGGASNAG